MTQEDRDLILRVEAKVDRMLDRMGRFEKTQDDHETRLRSTERWKYSVPISMLLAAGGIIGAMLSGRA